jgi:hypothetical protein
MATYGIGLVESSMVEEFILKIEQKLLINKNILIDISKNKDIEQADKFSLFHKFMSKREDIRNIALFPDYSEDKDINVLAYIAFIKYFDMELFEEDKLAFEESYNVLINDLSSWNDPEERKNVLLSLKYCVDNNFKYNFDNTEILQRIQNEQNIS